MRTRNVSRKSLLTLITLLTPTVTWAASTGSLTLSGSVAAVNSIVIAPNGSNNTSLNIAVGETGKLVATISETSNSSTGYIIQISSSNGGELRHSVDPNKKTTYTVKYGSGSYGTVSTTPTTVKTVASLSALTSTDSDLLVNVVAAPNAVQGSYSDTINLAIVAQ